MSTVSLKAKSCSNLPRSQRTPQPLQSKSRRDLDIRVHALNLIARSNQLFLSLILYKLALANVVFLLTTVENQGLVLERPLLPLLARLMLVYAIHICACRELADNRIVPKFTSSRVTVGSIVAWLSCRVVEGASWLLAARAKFAVLLLLELLLFGWGRMTQSAASIFAGNTMRALHRSVNGNALHRDWRLMGI